MITFRKRGHSSARRKEVGRRHQYRWWTQNLVGFSLESHQAQIKEFRSSKQFSDDWQLQRLRARHREVLKTRYDWDRHIWSAREQCFFSRRPSSIKMEDTKSRFHGKKINLIYLRIMSCAFIVFALYLQLTKIDILIDNWDFFAKMASIDNCFCKANLSQLTLSERKNTKINRNT